jgi:hypothetical protein
MMKRSTLLLSTAAFAFGALLGGRALAVHADPEDVQLTLEGCRNGSGGVPQITFPPTGPFVCPDFHYTGGNLGKGWNELDNVPHRVIAAAKNIAPAVQTYEIAVALDAEDAGALGYDIISAATLNTTLSDASCTAPVSGPDTTIAPGIGGIDVTRYRFLTITQNSGTTCVFDFYGRLAIGSHLFSGSSLHANMALDDGAGGISTSGIGARDVSIPVKDILPQSIDKMMTAAQDAIAMWAITKGPQDAVLNFGDTCDPGNLLAEEITFRVEWEIVETTPGATTVMSKVFANNPASRDVRVQVTDMVYVCLAVDLDGNCTTFGDLLHTEIGPDVDVPANTNDFLVLEYSFAIAPEDADLMVGDLLTNIAEATYTDIIFPDITLPGNTLATDVAEIQQGSVSNTLADISDVESIAGEGLSFRVDSTTPDGLGTFTNYALGAETTGPVNWELLNQAGAGFIEFNKTVLLDQPRITDGEIADTAFLEGSDGFSPDPASASANITSDATVELTITKTIPDVLQGTETASFTFEVRDSGDSLVDTVTIDFVAGETSNSATVTGLLPGELYSVSETASTPGFALNPSTPSPQTVEIFLPECTDELTFDNLAGVEAPPEVCKVTVPPGFEAGWEFTLEGPGCPVPGFPEACSLTTSGADCEPFPFVLQEGSYTITETPQPGWEITVRPRNSSARSRIRSCRA